MDLANQSAQYIPVFILILMGVGLGLAIHIASTTLGARAKHPKKNTPFECGVPPHGDAHRRFSVRFYLVALLFLLFDVEVIFLFPWAIIFKDFLKVNSFILWEMGFFMIVLLVGYYYVRRRGALEWE